MSRLIVRKLTQKLFLNACRYKSDKPYWLARFPDGKPRPFEEIPVCEESFMGNMRKLPDTAMPYFKKYGYVSKEWMGKDVCLLHLFHFDDMKTVYYADGPQPIRKSHRVMRQYREERPELYDNVGLGAGEGKEWEDFRNALRSGVSEVIIDTVKPSLEAAADDLVKILRIKANEGDVEPLPWLFRWAFESAGVVTLNRRMGALSESGCEEADKIVKAAAITNEMIGMAETDFVNYDKYYQQLVDAQDYMYNSIFPLCEEIASNTDATGVLKRLLNTPNFSKKNAITMILDIFQGALQTVPLTILMVMYNLARNPHVQDIAREEIQEIFPSDDSKYFDTVESLYKIPHYIGAIVWETLRLSPPIIGNGRILQKDSVLGGFLVPKGTNCILHQQVACVLEEFFKNPKKFKPMRHPSKRHAQLLYIFGARSRTCFGTNFAIIQMALVTSKIVKNFKISYKGGEIKMINKLHNEPEQPLFLTLEPLV